MKEHAIKQLLMLDALRKARNVIEFKIKIIANLSETVHISFAIFISETVSHKEDKDGLYMHTSLTSAFFIKPSNLSLAANIVEL